MVYELSTEKSRMARAALEQINELCHKEDFYCKDHPLLSTQRSSCVVSIRRNIDDSDNIKQGVLDFSFRDLQGLRLARAKVTICNSGDVALSSSPINAEGDDLTRLMYVYDLFLPQEFKNTIELSPDSVN